MKKNNNRRLIAALPTAMLDVFLGLASTFMSLAVLALVLISPIAKTSDIESKAELIVTITWDTGNSDVDLWFGLPTGQIVSYSRPHSGSAALDRDDLGKSTDTFIINGVQYTNPLNEEIIALRQLLPGTYIVNVHLYDIDFAEKPIAVEVKIQKINPITKTIFTKSVVLEREKHEIHVVKFDISNDGEIESIRTNEQEFMVGKSETGNTIPQIHTDPQERSPSVLGGQ